MNRHEQANLNARLRARALNLNEPHDTGECATADCACHELARSAASREQPRPEQAGGEPRCIKCGRTAIEIHRLHYLGGNPTGCKHEWPSAQSAPAAPKRDNAPYEQPASTTGREAGEVWNIEGGSLVGRRRIRDAASYWIADASSNEKAEQIIAEHNQHAQYAEQIRFLGKRLEAQAETMAKVVAERNGLREQNERLREALTQCVSLIESKDELAKVVTEPHVLALAHAALNHAEQGRGANARLDCL